MAHSNWETWGTEQYHCTTRRPNRMREGNGKASAETVALRHVHEHGVELEESTIQPHSPLSL